MKKIGISIIIVPLFVSTARYSLGQAAQIDPLGYTISTPHPIDPASGTTNPSALATQRQNPFLGSTPSGKATDGVIPLSLTEAIARGLRYNLGLIESNQTSADGRAQRLRALSALLPDVSLEGKQAIADQSLKEFGLKLPRIAGFPGLPAGKCWP